MDHSLVLAAMLVLTSQSKAATPQQPANLVRVYVYTAALDDAEVAARRASVEDLRAALAGKKKDLVLADTEAVADVTVEVVERAVTIPKVVFGMGVQPGQRPGFPGTAGPVREVHLLAKLTFREESAVFGNKNTPIESGGGWKSAADDIAKQVDKWIVDHRAQILRARDVKVP
jgi:hypothetical protein